MTNNRNLHEPMINDLNILKLVLNQFLRNDLHTVPKVQSLDYFLHDVLRTVGKVRSLDYNGTNQIIEGFISIFCNPDSGTLGSPRPGQVQPQYMTTKDFWSCTTTYTYTPGITSTWIVL